MKKMSDLMLALAEEVLAKPAAQSSREAIAAGLLLANVAWNRAVVAADGLAHDYRKVLMELRKNNPNCPFELKSQDYETLIAELMSMKQQRHSGDNRIIVVCGITPEDNVRVEWREQSGVAYD